MKHKINFETGHDCIRFECRHESADCAPGRGGSHGIHGLNIRWVVIGDKGAIQFLLYTGWLPEPSRDTDTTAHRPLPADIGYHARKPQFEGQKPMDSTCDILGGQCYFDGSSLNAKEPFRVLCNEGGDALWGYLEAVYVNRFEDREYPKPKPYEFARRKSGQQHA